MAFRQAGAIAVSDWLAMGGHGPFVWTAYGISLLALVCICALPLLRMRGVLRRLRRRWTDGEGQGQEHGEGQKHGEGGN